MKPTTSKHVSLLNQAYDQVEKVLVAWSDDHRFKARALEQLSNSRHALYQYVQTRNEDAIKRMPIPQAFGTNVIWNVRS
jgi:hypothetical protein